MTRGQVYLGKVSMGTRVLFVVHWMMGWGDPTDMIGDPLGGGHVRASWLRDPLQRVSCTRTHAHARARLIGWSRSKC